MKYSTFLFVSLLLIATSAFSATDDVLRTITVTGRAEVLVVPALCANNTETKSERQLEGGWRTLRWEI
jgi:phosphotransacetylase